MTKEEFKTVKAGDELYISKQPDNHDNIPNVGHIFTVKSIKENYATPVIYGLGGAWRYDCLERVQSKQLPIFN